MKHILCIVLFCSFSCLTLLSCSEEVQENIPVVDVDTERLCALRLQELDKVLFHHRDFLHAWAFNNDKIETRSSIPKDDRPEPTLEGGRLAAEDISKAAIRLLESFELTHKEVAAITGDGRTKLSELSDEEKVNLALLGYSACTLMPSNAMSSFHNVGTHITSAILTTRSIDVSRALYQVTECVLRPLGVRSALKSGFFKAIQRATFHTIRSLAVNVMLAVGVKTLSGIGWALMVADMVWCLYENKAAFQSVSCTYVIPVPEWWTKDSGIDLFEAQNLPTVVYAPDFQTIVYSELPKEELGTKNAIFRVLHSQFWNYEDKHTAEAPPSR